MAIADSPPRGELTRSRLIEAGTRAMMAKSYHAVGLSEILEASGVPKGSFYHHFKNKEEFGVAVIEHSVGEGLDLITASLADPSRPALARLKGLFEHFGNETCGSDFRRECLIAKFILEVGSLSEPMRIALKRGFDCWRDLVARCLAEAQDQGELHTTTDPTSLAEFVINAWEGTMIRLQVDRDRRTLDDFLNLTFERLLTPP